MSIYWCFLSLTEAFYNGVGIPSESSLMYGNGAMPSLYNSASSQLLTSPTGIKTENADRSSKHNETPKRLTDSSRHSSTKTDSSHSHKASSEHKSPKETKLDHRKADKEAHLSGKDTTSGVYSKRDGCTLNSDKKCDVKIGKCRTKERTKTNEIKNSEKKAKVCSNKPAHIVTDESETKDETELDTCKSTTETNNCETTNGFDSGATLLSSPKPQSLFSDVPSLVGSNEKTATWLSKSSVRVTSPHNNEPNASPIATPINGSPTVSKVCTGECCSDISVEIPYASPINIF